MLFVINNNYGGFELPEDYEAVKPDINYGDSRTDPDLIDIVLSDDYDGDLDVVEIPDEATDYEIFEYDGAETVIYVKEGKIHYAIPIEL